MEYTRVNGIGLWNSWTRNFQTPLQALLDLLDNSFDASISKLDFKSANETKSYSSSSSDHDDSDEDDDKIQEFFEGKIHISALNYNDVFDASADHLINKHKKSGILIMNNSEKPIKPISKILEVYHSTKGKRSDTMGENGVGLKQGCATLSDLSFIISRNKQILEIGLIAASLQKEEGIYLPYHTIEVPSDDEKKDSNLSSFLKEKIMEAIKSKNGFHECIEEFGYGNVDFGSSQLISYCMTMLSNDWGDYSFCIILSDLRHKSNVESHDTYKNNTGIEIEADENKFPSTPMTQQSPASIAENKSQSFSLREDLGKAENLLKELKIELPKFYIHVPPHFDFQIEGSLVTFSHWQSRLVELWSFDVRIDPTNNWLEMNEAEWKYPSNGYNMKLYLGFDPVLAGSSSRNSACSLFFYARQSGRLIKSIQDARAILGLVNSGSDFSQGLTVIVDDYDGNLPLNPTKQDIAFGEEKHGIAHRTNLFAWISAYVHFFWKHHERKYKTEKKTKLSKNILGFLDQVEKHTTATKNLPMRPLKDLHLTTYVDIPWVKHHTGRIRSRSNKIGILKRGRGTKFRLTEELVFSDEESISPKKTKKQKRKRKQSLRSLTSSDEEDLQDFAAYLSPNGARNRRRATIATYDQNSVFTDEEDMQENAKYLNGQASADDVPSEDSDDYESHNGDRRKSYEYDDNEAGTEEIREKVRGLEKELKNARTEQENAKNNWKAQINEQENKISKLKKKISGLERMMKAMIRSQSMI